MVTAYLDFAENMTLRHIPAYDAGLGEKTQQLH